MRADDQDKSAPAPPAQPGADKSFLGPEFITWLYFFLEHENFEIALTDAFPDKVTSPPAGVVRFQIGKRVTLRTLDATGARVSLSGPDLDDSGELLQAVKRGAYIETLELWCAIGERVYGFTLRGSDGGISGVKLPDLFSTPDDEEKLLDDDPKKPAKKRAGQGFDDVLVTRLLCLDDIDRVVDALFRRFVTRRIARAWPTDDVMLLRKKVAAGLASKLG